VIGGGSGLIGRRLTQRLLGDGFKVSILTRSPSQTSDHPNLRFVPWNAKEIPDSQEPVDVVINLAGAGIADHRWTASYKKQILDSRLQTTGAFHRFITEANHKPRVFVSGSAVGYYGANRPKPADETAEPGADYLADVCVKWEKAALGTGIRTVLLRTGIVMAPEGGAFPRLLTPFKFYAGAYIGSGKQPLPWIHIDDIVSIILFTMDHETLEGPINAVAPERKTNKEFAKLLGSILNVRVVMGLPEFVVNAMLGERAEVLTKGQNAIPKRLQELGFTYKHPEAREAIQSIMDDNPIPTKFSPRKV